MNNSGVLHSVSGFVDKIAIVVGQHCGLDGVHCLCVGIGRAGIAHLSSELAAQIQSVHEGHSVPEEIGRLHFFPEVTAVGLPILGQPVQMVLDGSSC